MDIANQLLGKCSPYIHTYAYDIDDRTLIIECMKAPEDMEAYLRIVFEDITQFKEVSLLKEFDDENLDDLVAIETYKSPQGEKGYSITTYKKEVIIYTDKEPFTERV